MENDLFEKILKIKREIYEISKNEKSFDVKWLNVSEEKEF